MTGAQFQDLQAAVLSQTDDASRKKAVAELRKAASDDLAPGDTLVVDTDRSRRQVRSVGIVRAAKVAGDGGSIGDFKAPHGTVRIQPRARQRRDGPGRRRSSSSSSGSDSDSGDPEPPPQGRGRRLESRKAIERWLAERRRTLDALLRQERT